MICSSSIWLSIALRDGKWSADLIDNTTAEICQETDMFTNETMNFLFVVPMLIDLLTYFVNGILICVVRKKMNTIIGTTLSDKNLEAKRLAVERLITKSVLKTVSYHFFMTTCPMLPLMGMSVAYEQGYILAEIFYIGAAVTSLFTFTESMVNVYIYVSMVPMLRSIVFGDSRWEWRFC